MKKVKKTILKCIICLMCIGCITTINSKLVQAKYVAEVIDLKIASVYSGGATTTRYQYKDISFLNNYWLVDIIEIERNWHVTYTDCIYKYYYGMN